MDNINENEVSRIWCAPLLLDGFNNKISGYEFGIAPDSFRLVFLWFFPRYSIGDSLLVPLGSGREGPYKRRFLLPRDWLERRHGKRHLAGEGYPFAPCRSWSRRKFLRLRKSPRSRSRCWFPKKNPLNPRRKTSQPSIPWQSPGWAGKNVPAKMFSVFMNPSRIPGRIFFGWLLKRLLIKQ